VAALGWKITGEGGGCGVGFAATQPRARVCGAALTRGWRPGLFSVLPLEAARGYKSIDLDGWRRVCMHRECSRGARRRSRFWTNRRYPDPNVGTWVPRHNIVLGRRL